jgi:formamidopyrimidine-DNA glycosylase
MPELPEVEAIAVTLRPFVARRKILAVHVFHPIATQPQSPAQVSRSAHNRKIDSVARRGKYLFLALDRGFIEMHFRFDGHLIWFTNAKQLLDRANQKPGGTHVDVALELDKGVLAFADGRHLGRVHFWEAIVACPGAAKLGVDAMSKKFTQAAFLDLLKKSRRPLKEFLLDQSRIAGVGNIYSAEALWHARLDPRRRTDSLTRTEGRRLHKGIVSVLRRALECCLHPAPDFRDPDWCFQGIDAILRVYDREGEPCCRDGHPIQRLAQGGRSTYFCAYCQK